MIQAVRQAALHERAATLQAEFQRRFGLYAAGPDALNVLLDGPISEWLSLDTSGALVRVSMESMFRRVRATLNSLKVEVWHVPTAHELLVSDAPAFTFRYSNGDTVIVPNVAIGDSHGVAMPIANNCLIALGPKSKDEELSPDQVTLFNKLQIQVSHQYIYYRPSSRLRDFVSTELQRV